MISYLRPNEEILACPDFFINRKYTAGLNPEDDPQGQMKPKARRSILLQSQPLVIRRAGPPVRPLEVNFCDPGIMLDHFQRTVPQ